jgi:hypothetical protein
MRSVLTTSPDGGSHWQAHVMLMHTSAAARLHVPGMALKLLLVPPGIALEH